MNSLKALEIKISPPAARMVESMQGKKEGFWLTARNRHVLRLFKEMATRIPAYRDFLQKNKINSKRITTYEDLALVPPMTKDNYLRQYPLEKLVWDGHLAKSYIYSSTSGSTGHPFYFPRDTMIEWQSSIYHDFFLNQDPGSKNASTLVIVGFGMGAWIGGLLTTAAFREVARRNQQAISLLTPGSNKKEIFEGLKHIGVKYDQIVLCGYPPFIKDVLDEAPLYGVNIKKYKFKLLFAAEAFSEGFRNYVAAKAGIKNIYRDITNIYGTADLGTMALETPLSILVRRLAFSRSALFKNLFPEVNRVPTLAQFNPLFVNFDSVAGHILCSGNNALPLLRYFVGDQGGVLSYSQIEQSMLKNNIIFNREAIELKLQKNLNQLPFVYIYQRSDLSTKWYGAIIYPEHVREALEHKTLQKKITGRFVLTTKTDKNHNEFLEVNLEMAKNQKIKPALGKKLGELIQKKLFERNGEYSYLHGLMPQRMNPKIVLLRHEHPEYFSPQGKQKWAKK